METFNTPNDNQPISIIIKTSSDAVMTGPNKIFMTIYHEDTPNNWRKVSIIEVVPNKEFSATIEKPRTLLRDIIRIKSKFAVDNTSLKESIAKTTTLDYKLNGGLGNEEDFETNYTDHKSEYNLGSANDETFTIVKKIKVNLQ